MSGFCVLVKPIFNVYVSNKIKQSNVFEPHLILVGSVFLINYVFASLGRGLIAESRASNQPFSGRLNFKIDIILDLFTLRNLTSLHLTSCIIPHLI